MNKEIVSNNDEVESIGVKLIQARRLMNFTRQDIANRLCLKVNIIRNIEKDSIPGNLSPVFFWGYIYSYARLVNVSNSELFLILDKYKSSYTLSNQIFIKNLQFSKINNKNFFVRFFNLYVIMFLIFIFSLYFFYYRSFYLMNMILFYLKK